MTGTVEVVYALPEQQWAVAVNWRAGLRAADALDAALEMLPIDDWRTFKIGVFGAVCEPAHLLEAGDRVEIYRELAMDARQARRQRAQQQQKQQQNRSTRRT